MKNFVRLANREDSSAILDIYKYYVIHTAVTFETELPSEAEFADRIEAIAHKYPYLVYVADNKIAGYTYAAKFRERAAYCYGVESSIYIKREFHGTKAATFLYLCLFDMLRDLGYHNVFAACTLPNEKSVKFHKKLGFDYIGTFHKAGYKLDKWHDLAWFEKTIAEDGSKPGEIKSMSQLGIIDFFKLLP